MAAAKAPGRPRSFDTEVILEDALELFWRSGYRTTSIRDLEAALGVSQSSLYNAFGSKQGLLEAAMDRYEARINEEVLSPLETSDTGLEAIDEFFDALTHWVTHDGRRGCMIINLMAEDAGDDDGITRRTRRYRRRVRDALANGLRRAVALGETIDDDLDGRTDALFGILLGLNIAARGGASDTEIKALVAGAHHLTESWRLG